MSFSEQLKILSDLSAELECGFSFSEPLCEHTTFKIGGPCDLMIFPKSSESLSKLVKTAQTLGIKNMILGNGSNVLFDDNGYRGVIFLIGQDMSEIIVNGCVITAYAGALLTKVCKTALEYSLTGMEFAWGIPGTAGGAVYMNAGAYGGEIKDIVRSVTCIKDGKEVTYDRSMLCFDYRRSRFTDSQEIIVSADFELAAGEQSAIKEKMNELLSRRKAKQPLEYPSAGSTFKRPPGTYAGLVIEQCGLKGYRVGNAMISEKHANFAINVGGATSKEMKTLITDVQRIVKEKTGYTLECEVKLIDE